MKVLYSGWDDLVKSKGWYKGHRDSLFHADSWRPSFIIFVLADFQDKFSSALNHEIKAWTDELCQDRKWRHVYAGVYEFASEDDAKAFAGKWAAHDGDKNSSLEEYFSEGGAG